MTQGKLIVSCVSSLALRALLSPLRLLPVRRKRVLFVSFRGKQYSCNPKAISEALEGTDGLEIVWAFHEPEKFSFLIQRGIRVVSDRGLKFVVLALTSRVVCTNTYYKPYLPRRKKQFYLRTWHGGGAYKRVDYPAGLMGFYIRIQQQGADLYLSSSAEFTRGTLRGAFGYRGEVLECGMPRNDLLVSGDWKKRGDEVRRELGLTGHVALYAPTYREDSRKSDHELETETLRAALSERFGGTWTVLFRGHHVVSGDLCAAYGDRDVTDYPDMQPLLCAADVLITDYSSSMWDMSLTGKPVFLYCTDLTDYRRERDFFTDISAWPFPLAENNRELSRNILNFDESAYLQAVERHHRILGTRESGHAAQAAAERIRKECGL